MRAKKLGRHELLNWVNTITQSDYSRIESLSDGVAFCQLLDAFYPSQFNLNQLKHDWERNFGIVNEILLKLKTHKQIDPTKLTKSKFTHNFEFLQFVYDYIAKNCGENSVRYMAYDRRLEIIKIQNPNNKINDIRKFLPTHLIPNDLILKMEKQKYFGTNIDVNNIITQKDNDYSTPTNKFSTQNLDLNLKNYNSASNQAEDNSSNTMLEKYKEFFEILKEDLNKMMERNISLSREIQDVEEERQYYLDKLKNVLKFCELNSNKNKVTEESEKNLQNIAIIIKHQPEDFK